MDILSAFPDYTESMGFSLSFKIQREMLKMDMIIDQIKLGQLYENLCQAIIFSQVPPSTKPRRTAIPGQIVELWKRKTHLLSSNTILPLLVSYRRQTTLLSNESFFLFQ